MMSADELADLRAEVERLRERERHAIEYERRINWDVTCGGCADHLDASYREYIRAEKAEAERDALQRQVDNVRAVVDEVWNDAERQRSRRDEPLGAAYLHRATALTGAVKRLRAALDALEPADQPHPTPEADDPCPISDGAVEAAIQRIIDRNRAAERQDEAGL